MSPVSQLLLKHLIAVASYYGCSFVLEVTPTGIHVVAKKGTVVAGSTAISRHTEISFWLDANEKDVTNVCEKAFRALP